VPSFCRSLADAKSCQSVDATLSRALLLFKYRLLACMSFTCPFLRSEFTFSSFKASSTSDRRHWQTDPSLITRDWCLPPSFFRMPPPGRRRLESVISSIALLFLLISTASAASAVLGIDLGTEYIKAALVKPGIPLEIVLTKDSKRKETAAVAFKPLRSRVNTAESSSYPERVYGGDAVALSARFPSDVYPNLKPLLGLKLTDDLVSEYGGTHSGLKMVESAETGTIGFQSDCFVAEEQPWSVEELLAMELKNIRTNAENMAGKGSNIADAVITVPSFYTVEEKRAISMAADLAGLRVLSLISDGLAVGLNYATSRTFPTINEGGRPEYHLVYDMGAGSTTASVLKFQGRVVKDIGKFNKTVQEVHVIGTSWDKTLGGDALNRIILNDMIEKITSTTHMTGLKLTAKHIRSHGRTMAKLWKEAERLRHVLSANTETSTSFEGLYYEDFKFKYKLSRTEFEDLASVYLSRVQKPIEQALESAKLSLPDLESIILHGGAVRTPFVQRQLEAIAMDPEKIRTNVNADEAAVFGAAFKAAATSPSFRVKEIRAAENAVYPISISWTIDGKDKHQKLFVPTSQVGAEKQISVKATEDFSFSLSQQVAPDVSDLPILVLKTQNLTESVKSLSSKFGCESSNISTMFAIRLSPVDGLPEAVRGSVSCEVLGEQEPKKGGVVEGVKDLFGFGSRKNDQEVLKDGADSDSASSTSSTEPETSSISSAAESETSGPLSGAATSGEKPKEVKKRIETIYIGLSADSVASPKFGPDNIERLKQRLNAFDKSDRSRLLREETLNTLEGYTYKIRDILEDEGFIIASSEAQRDNIEAKSNDVSMWLYGDGAEASRETLKERMDELRALVQPIQKRKEESKKRPDEIQKLKDALTQADTMVKVVKQQREAQVVAESEASSTASGTSQSQTTEPSSTSTDDFADLDDETVTVSTSTKAQAPKMPAPIYSQEDVATIVQKQESVQKWLDEKLAQQEKLTPTDDPAVLSSDLSAKSREINEAVMNLLTKQMKPPPKPKVKKARTTKSTKTASTTATGSGSSSVETGESPQATVEPSDGEESEFERMHRINQEIEQSMAAQKSEAEKTKKSTKAKVTGKAKKKGNGKSKGKDKRKSENHEEL